MAAHNELGTKGEALARTYLEDKGYRILEKNWVYARAEVDLIAYYDKRIIFVEVKARTSVGYGQPEEFVGDAKQRNLKRAAEQYIFWRNFNGEIRFDIIAIVFNKQGGYTIRHIEDAFW
ncbi:YraN family protein [Desertivirga brevis]|uniref:YraN family protein n=1 Tax=Desertivirga brevis TaxID=2810310 RepID=UPI001A96F093|nr:YraN family protein [Pedobacter sp. SYSU D00873]